MSRTAKPGATAVRTPPTVTSDRVTMIVSPRRRPSPRRPRTGEATAPVIRVTVKDHCAVLSLRPHLRLADAGDDAPDVRLAHCPERVLPGRS